MSANAPTPPSHTGENLPVAPAGTRWRVMRHFRREVILAGIAGVFLILLSIDRPEGLSIEGWKALCLLVFIVTLWVTNLIPLAVSSLLAIAAIPLLGLMEEGEAYAYFGSKVVFFIMGAFILGAALVGSGLSTRLATWALTRFGKTPRRLIYTFFGVGALGSCIMSEHAVAAMLFPIAMSVSRNMDLATENRRFGRTLFMAMAWGCIVGGTLTILGGGRGPLAIGMLEEATGGQMTVGFMEYVAFDLPLVAWMLLFGFLMIKRSGGLRLAEVSPARDRLKTKQGKRGNVTNREYGVGIVMALTVVLWITRGHEWGLANIAIISTTVLFVFGWMTWREVEDGVNWGVILMYGGAICLGAALHKSGTTVWLTEPLTEATSLSPQIILFSLAVLSMVLTELMSNSAVIAVLLPVALELGAARGIDLRIVTMTVVLPSNFAFAFPIATPANALAYSSGFLDMKTMVVRGLLMDLLCLVGFGLLLFFYWPLLGYSMGT